MIDKSVRNITMRKAAFIYSVHNVLHSLISLISLLYFSTYSADIYEFIFELKLNAIIFFSLIFSSF